MSRIGKLPISIPEGVKVVIDGRRVICEGKRGKLTTIVPEGVNVVEEQGELKVKIDLEGKPRSVQGKISAYYGLVRALCQNMVTGITQGFQKVLLIEGVGYKAEAQKDVLVLQVGYSQPVRLPIPESIQVKVEQNKIVVEGADKMKVGDYAAQIRKVRKVEPYKGKGIRYANEHVRRKAGKAAKVGAK